MAKYKLNCLWIPRGIALAIPLYLTILYVLNRNFYFDIWIFYLWIACFVAFFLRRPVTHFYFFINFCLIVLIEILIFQNSQLVNQDLNLVFFVISALIVPFNTDLFYLFESKDNQSKFAWKRKALWLPRVLLIVCYCLLLICFAKYGFFRYPSFNQFVFIAIPIFFALTFFLPILSGSFFVNAGFFGRYFLIEYNEKVNITGFSLVSMTYWLTLFASLLLVVLYLYPNLARNIYTNTQGRFVCTRQRKDDSR